MVWKKRIAPGEKVGLRLTKAKRVLLLTGMVFLHREVEQAIQETPANRPVMISLDDLEDLAGHVTAEANHAKDKAVEKLLDGIFVKVEELLDVYTDE